MIGQKGVPATFGGIEHHVEQLGRRLVERGHRVTVFNRPSYTDHVVSPYLGMEVRTAPTISSKHLDAIIHSGTSTAKAMVSGYDVVHFHALGPGLWAFGPRYLSRSSVVLTVHGLDHERGKWGLGAKAVLRTAYWMSGRVPERTIVVSEDLRDHYLAEFGRQCDYIPNGVDRPAPVSADVVRQRFGLEPGSYAMFVARLVPEKGPDLLLRAFAGVPGDARLVIVGDSSFSADYVEQLRALAARDPRVLLTGFVFGEDLRALYQHAGLFVQPSLLEGLPLTLLEGISHGLPVLASDIAPHQEVLGVDGGPGRRLFASGNVDSLTSAFTEAWSASVAERPAAQAFREVVLGRYNWDEATDQLEQVYLQTVDRGSHADRRVPGQTAAVK